MPKPRLPDNVGHEIFADSPTRITEPDTRPDRVSPSSEVEISPSMAPASIVASSSSAPTPSSPLKTEESGEGQPQVKLTYYLSKTQFDFLETEVFRRRRAGLRTRSTELMREIVDFWIGAQKRGPD